MFYTFNPLLIEFIIKEYYDKDSQIQPKEILGIIKMIGFIYIIKLLNRSYLKVEYQNTIHN
tara:strand:- start:699 stop:881 length:183 start_codon:yes stop_codon:yes gene_type:complete